MDDAEFNDVADYEYVDVGEVGDAAQYYAIGDSVIAFVLEVDEDEKISLTQFDDEDIDVDDPVAELTGENAGMVRQRGHDASCSNP